MRNEIKDLKIFFDSPMVFEIEKIRPLIGIVGLYFIFTKQTLIQYPFGKSRLLYIGMSEKRTSSIANRLTGHFDGKSKNFGLINYRKVEQLFFTFVNFEMVRTFWGFRIENLETYFILDFVKKYGVYPICNNKSGFDILNKSLNENFIIDWSYFN